MKLILTNNLNTKHLITKQTIINPTLKYYIDNLDTSIIEYFYIQDINLYIKIYNIEWLRFKLRKFKFIEYRFEIDKSEDLVLNKYIQWEYKMRNIEDCNSSCEGGNSSLKSYKEGNISCKVNFNDKDGNINGEMGNTSNIETINKKNKQTPIDKQTSIDKQTLIDKKSFNKKQHRNKKQHHNKKDHLKNNLIQKGLQISFNSDIYKSFYTSLTNPKLYKHKKCPATECFKYVLDNKSVDCNELHSKYSDRVVNNLVYCQCIIKNGNKYCVNEYLIS